MIEKRKYKCIENILNKNIRMKHNSFLTFRNAQTKKKFNPLKQCCVCLCVLLYNYKNIKIDYYYYYILYEFQKMSPKL